MLFHSSTVTTALHYLHWIGNLFNFLTVSVTLNFNFRSQRIGTDSPLRPHSSELRSLDLFLCVCVKDQVYSQRVRTVN